MEILEAQKKIWATTESKGFHQAKNSVAGTPEGFNNRLMLIVDEIAEAHEEFRSGHGFAEVYYKDGKPEGIPIELADAVIRLLDLAEICGFNMETAMEEKMAYNEGRPYMHGRKF